jgi:DNA polymerase III epsilon subunit-like protein
MLSKFIEEANKADELVGHNGDRFDLPWIRTRCLYNGIDVMPDYKTIDTLQWARRVFYFNSNRLDYLGKYLGVGGKIKTEFDLWKNVLLKNDRKSLKRMVEYCKRDVEMLQEVYQKLARYLPHKTHVGVLKLKDKWTSPFNGSTDVRKSKTRVTAAGSVRHQMLCNKTKRYYSISDAIYNQYLKSK